LTIKIVALVDALGNLARFVLMQGQRHDSVTLEPLISGVAVEALLADTAYDNNRLRAEVADVGAKAVIPPKPIVRTTSTVTSTCTSGNICSKTSSARTRNSAG
jgi:transposase